MKTKIVNLTPSKRRVKNRKAAEFAKAVALDQMFPGGEREIEAVAAAPGDITDPAKKLAAVLLLAGRAHSTPTPNRTLASPWERVCAELGVMGDINRLAGERSK